ncbi:uncharacterized protein LOC108100611 isoform X2 [Drosophila ficusphila]|uniref:uncharacterized protein LOC108100611 isoform X2 n=1 Tax=Drosophila ficusphila TaxID=30025 RepID=UPI0007E779F1|nr:uncharacterized protein LOC108100611 isoform X2 [Drosophila ficusphila]
MADVRLIVSGSPAVHLEPDIIYRIGRKKGLEISIADESMELAHATACILRRGVVRLAALVGRIFVNGQEKTVVDIGQEDAFAGKVKLRFGNVEARLEIGEENDEAHDSSGFGECLKDRSINITTDSCDIPETQPPSANTTINTTGDSFFVPETQAVAVQRPSTVKKVSLGDDFVIPETQDLLTALPPAQPDAPVINQELMLDSDADSSEGSLIRMCTQDYNEDAIDDFDSSQILCDVLPPLPPPKPKETPEENKKQDVLDATDLEMSALNWSASNSKFCALSSTKAEKVPPRSDACITPDLTAPSDNLQICTPDLLDLIMDGGARAGSSSPDLFIRPANKTNTTTPQFGGIKQLVVATIETPTATPDKEDAASSQDINQDMIATQRFPGNKLLESDVEDDDLPNQDFVPTQAFNLGRPQPSEGPKSSEDDEPNQDFIATQAFNLGRPQTVGSSEPGNESCNQDFIATQVFPSNNSRCQDFVATQPFHLVKQASLNEGNKENISRKPNTKKTSEMISGTIATSPVNPNEEPIKFFEPCVVKDKNHYQKICQIEGVFSDLSNKARWRNDATSDGSRKRIARSESPPATPSRKNQRLESKLRKRRATSVDKNSEPLSKSLCIELEVNPIPEEQEKIDKKDSAFKVEVNQWQSRRDRINKRVDAPGKPLEEDKVKAEVENTPKKELSIKKETKTRRKKLKNTDTSKDETAKDVPISRTRRKTSVDIEMLPEKEKETNSAKTTKADDSKNSSQASPKTSRKTSGETPNADKAVKSKKERKSNIAEISKEKPIKDIPKGIIRTRRQTTEEEAKKASMTEKSRSKESKTNDDEAETAREVQPSKSVEAKKPRRAVTKKGDTSKDVSKAETPNTEKLVKPGKKTKKDEETSKADTSKDTMKPITRNTRKASEEKAEVANPKIPVKSEKGKRTIVEASKTDSSKNEPKTTTRTRRKTLVDDPETLNVENPIVSVPLKRAVVRLSRTSVDQTTAQPHSSTPSVEKVSSSTAAGKRPKKGAAIEELSSSSINTKKARISADEENSINRLGATTTRLSQPDPDPLKAFNQYVRKAKADGKIKIAFTMCNRPALESVLKALKHVVETTEDPLQCDLLIMDKGERTYKFLTAIASNKPVLSTNWLHSVKKNRSIDIKADHLFNDDKFKEVYKFKPLSVMEHSRVLSGLHFMLGEDIIPKPNEMKVIIQSAGGKVHIQPPSLAVSVDLYVVTTSKDTKFKRRLNNYEKVHFIKTEGVMQALVQHNTELLDEHKLKL